MLEWIRSVLKSPSRLYRLRKRRRAWDENWSTPGFSPKWGGRDAPPEIAEAVASGWLPLSGKVLDIGCGLGEIAAWFAQRGYDALGVDIAPSAVRQAKAVHAALPHPPKFLAVDLSVDVPPGGPFDILIDRGCLHNISKRFVPDFVRCIAAASAPQARMLLFMRAYRNERPFADETETREHVAWTTEALRGYFAIESYTPTYLSSDGKLDPSNPLPGIVYRVRRVASSS